MEKSASSPTVGIDYIRKGSNCLFGRAPTGRAVQGFASLPCFVTLRTKPLPSLTHLPRTNLSAGHQVARHPSLRSFAVSPMPCSFQAAGASRQKKAGHPKVICVPPPAAHRCYVPPAKIHPFPSTAPKPVKATHQPFALPHPFLHSLIPSLGFGSTSLTGTGALSNTHLPSLSSGTSPVSQPHPPN